MTNAKKQYKKTILTSILLAAVFGLGVLLNMGSVFAVEQYPVPRPDCAWCKDVRTVSSGWRLTHPAFNYDNAYGQTHRNPFNSDYTRVLMCEGYYDEERYINTLKLTLPPQRFPDKNGVSKRHTARGPVTGLISALQDLSMRYDYDGENESFSQTQESVDAYAAATFNILGTLGSKLSSGDTGSACKAVYFSPYPDESSILYYLNRNDLKVHKLDISNYANPVDTALNMSYRDERNQNCVDYTCKALILGFTDPRSDPTGHPRILITTDFGEQGAGEPQSGDPGFIGNLKTGAMEQHPGIGLCDSRAGYWPNHNIHGDWSPDGKYFMKISGDGDDGVRRGPNHPSGLCDSSWYQPCTGGVQSSSRKPYSDNCQASTSWTCQPENGYTGCGTADWYDNQNQGVYRDYLTHPDWRFSNEWYVAGNGAFSVDAPNGDNHNPFVYDNWKVVQVFYNRKDVWDADRNDFTGCDTHSCYYHNVLLKLSSAGNWTNTGANGKGVGANYHGMPSPTLSNDGKWLYTLHTDGKYSLADFWCAIRKSQTECNYYDYAMPSGVAQDVIGNYESMGIYLYDISPNSGDKIDVNSDGFVNIQDIQACVNVILEAEKGASIVAKAKAVIAPVDTCDVLDLQMIVNEILR